jgi:hypothetical protein
MKPAAAERVVRRRLITYVSAHDVVAPHAQLADFPRRRSAPGCLNARSVRQMIPLTMLLTVPRFDRSMSLRTGFTGEQ